MPPKRIKLVLLGMAGVGKTSLFKRMLGLDFSASQEATMGAAYHAARMLERPDGKLVSLGRGDAAARYEGGTVWSIDIWDTAGQERYNALVPMYYRGAHVAFVVHDGQPDSVNAARRLIKDVRRDNPACAVCLVHNKSDLATFRYSQEFADEIAPDHAWFTSALENKNVNEALTRACRVAVDRFQVEPPEESVCSDSDKRFAGLEHASDALSRCRGCWS